MPAPLPTVLNIGITGKQNILPDEKSIVYNRIRSRIEDLLRTNNTVEFAGYSSMARGADTIFAEVVSKEFNQPVRIVLPFAIEEYRKHFTDTHDLTVFNHNILKHGVYKVIDNDPHINDRSKNEAYQQAGRFITDQSDELIIVWDKIKPSNEGSTGDILGIVACTRSTNQLNIIDIAPVEPDNFHEEIIRQTSEADEEATRLKKKYNSVWQSSIILGWLAAVCFATNAAFFKTLPSPFPELLSVAEFLLVISVFLIIKVSKNRKNHLRFISQRLKAEKLRLIETFYNASIQITSKELTGHNDEALSALIKNANDRIENQSYISKPYSFYCVKNLIEEQINYHVSFLFNKMAGRIHKFEMLSKWITSLFLLNLLLSFISFLIGYFKFPISFYYWHELSVFAGIFLSASFAAVETILYFREWSMLKKNSSHMIDYLEEKKELLKENFDQVDCGELLRDISVKMLTDNKNWDYIIRGKPDEVKLF